MRFQRTKAPAGLAIGRAGVFDRLRQLLTFDRLSLPQPLFAGLERCPGMGDLFQFPT